GKLSVESRPSGPQAQVTTSEIVKNVILGTAGHIDHGKSSLVKALTGIDPDRLKEEKERGITIDLGFANLSYSDGLTVGIVDVPGHERLIKNMLAGAGGIDVVMMVIAADESIMPQSREHLAICELLKIKAGIVALTKADLVDEEWLHLVSDDIRDFVHGTFLEGAHIIPVSARTGANLDVLREEIRRVAHTVKPKLVNGLFRLPIDRVFTLKGFGTVVTGTALSGSISLDSPVEILPSRITSKVRGLQSHGRSAERAFAGQRIGMNVQGVDKDSLRRGDVVVTPGRLVPTHAIDAHLEMLRDAPLLKSRSLVHFYSGTSETTARIILYDREEIKAGESCYCQYRLEDPVVALSGDRYIIRRFSPLETIGGGEILDPHPVKRKRKTGLDDLAVFEEGSVRDKIDAKVRRAHIEGCSVSEIEGWVQGDLPEISAAIQSLVAKGILYRVQDQLFHHETLKVFRETLREVLSRYHKENPLKPGMPKDELRSHLKLDAKRLEKATSLLPSIEDVVIEKETLRLREFKVMLTTVDENMRDRILTILGANGFQPPLRSDLAESLSIKEKELGDLLRLLANEGALVRINDSLYMTREHYDAMFSILRSFFAKKQDMSVAEFRDILGTSRKYALPMLEHLDSHKITLRVGDVRKFVLK
ncbi:MAG TPA: selenocysteine-specific translation elongation factor, partial [Dissulfurispiraceae bacterium]|nr:selenocysteine-specific translation elongation factor [Dissulfurispiraceae bacterium]